MKCSSALLILALLAAILVPAPARAQQQPPVNLEIQAGLDNEGQYRVGHWFPITIVAANDGADLRGTVELSFPGDREGGFRYDLDLPGGARKRITVPVVTTENHGSVAVSLQADGELLLRRNVPLDPISSDQLVIGVVSSDPSLLNSLRAIRSPNGLDVAVVHLDPARLPDAAPLLGGLGALFIHDLATAELPPAQREALLLWTRLGGQLIVGGGPSAERTVPGLAELLPVEPGQLRADVSAASLSRIVNDDELPNPAPLTALGFTLRAGASDLDGAGLIAARPEGAGRVLFTAFDLAALRTWAGEAALWQSLVVHQPRAEIGQSFRIRNENIMRDALQLAALRLPSTGLLLLLVLCYIIVVGPLNFWLLRRARRVELAWVTTPLIVAGFLAASYGASFALRGTSAQITQLTVVQSFEGAEQSQATSFLAVFSPQRRSYDLGFGPATLVTPGSFEGFQFSSVPVTSDENSVAVRDLLIDVSALRNLIVEQAVGGAPTVQSSLQRTDRRVEGEVRLEQGPALRDALIVSQASSQSIGDLGPGASASFTLDTSIANFPNQVSFGQGGSINRDRVMYSLFGYDRFAIGGPTFQASQGLPDPTGVYLIGWTGGALLETTLNGSGTSQQGETLYIIRLDTPS